MNGAFLAYLHNATWATYLVAFVLSSYFVSVFWVFLYRFFYLSEKLAVEKEAVEYLLSDFDGTAKGSYLEKLNLANNYKQKFFKSRISLIIKFIVLRQFKAS